MFPPPTAYALTLCEKIVVEEDTRRLTLVNCLTMLAVDRFPSLPQDFYALAALTGGAGDATIQLNFYHPETLEVVHSFQRRIQFQDRLTEVQVRFHVRDCIFPVPGRYHVALLVDGDPVA